MSFYEDRILPYIINKACSASQVMELRSMVVPAARGTVLEVGMGTAINLPFYDPELVHRIYGLEPSPGMRRLARANLETSSIEVQWLDLPGEKIPLPDQSVDTVLLTFTLCSIADAPAALAQMRRVLRPGGELIFLEHGEAGQSHVRRWQHRITPFWKPLAGGCHLNRNIADLIRSAGFEITELHNHYIPGAPKILSYIYRGRAVRAD